MSRVCTTPWKHAYATKQRALQSAGRRAGKAFARLRAYRCSCRAWHLTSQEERR